MGNETSKDKDKGPSSKGKPSSKSSKQTKKQPSNRTGKSAGKQSVGAGASKSAESPMKVDLVLTVALVIAAFMLGIFVRGFFLSESGVSNTPLSNTSVTLPEQVSTGTSSGVDAGTGAPEISLDQIDKGQMPAGHPVVGDKTKQPDSSQDPVNAMMDKVKKIDSDVPASGPLTSGGQSVEVTDPKKK